MAGLVARLPSPTLFGSRMAEISVPRPASLNLPSREVSCMAKKKGVRIVITLECTEARGLGQTPSRYTTQKNKKNDSQRLELRKYNKYLRRMTVHREIK
mmetsp:Transcript_5053/g.14531  ORF Transcript_5053/g.14531 Transcript_5053/m.14531 type:complete len:99 (-) Transcript_5053:142-438(-)|eukprot:CAMPEP_0206134636 /NCGR_PEP_ID=MMETSP1473-20131121/123_1 /ASSEMBLY_ACC=CAM_ASM_001109 /TAXON_ID=1461547 /ORGANISM="Stichococcus sp, Strain RCC1054" /LENGTH=98 /DNA_ID=CAMNT_0053526253 /DNA_START=118 /DNA_END=414 /DNA_ORIENTATION=+